MRLRRVRAVWWITGAVALAALVAAGFTTLASGAGTPKAVASSTAQVRRGTVSTVASSAGTVIASATRGLSFSMSGTVTELTVKAGDQVSAGQVLARIDDTDAQSAVADAQTQVDAARDALTRAEQAASPTPTPSACSVIAPAGDVVATGDPTPSPSPSPSTRASGSGTGSGSGSGTGTGSTPGWGSGSGGPGTAGSSGDCTGGTARTGGGRGTDAIYTAQQQLNNANLALTQAKRKLDGTVISAPIAGRVLSVAGTVGSTESPGSGGFIVLGNAADTQVSAAFTETDVAHLAVGQAAAITLPDQDDKQFTGKVAQVSPAGTTSDRLVKYTVLIAFDQPPDDVLYGQSATVVVTTDSVSDVLCVPSNAVVDITAGADGGTGMVTVRADGHDTPRTVRIGLRGDQYTEIRSGLALGDTVVIGGR